MRLFQFAQPAKHFSVITALVTLITFSVYAAQNPATPDQRPVQPDPTSIYTESTGLAPGSVIEYYKQHEPNTKADYFTLATAYYAKFDFERALDFANRALSLAPDETAKSICCQLVAQCHGALGHYSLAQEAAISGSRHNPHSAELAALRIAYAHQDGDGLAEASARDHLMQLDPNFAKSPKCDPITAGVIIVALVCATYTCVVHLLLTEGNKTPEVAKVIADSLKDLLHLAAPANLLGKFRPISN